jgi:hypothetical protein
LLFELLLETLPELDLLSELLCGLTVGWACLVEVLLLTDGWLLWLLCGVEGFAT